MTKWGLPQECKIGLTYEKSLNVIYHTNINTEKGKHIRMLIHAVKCVIKFTHSWLHKNPHKAGIEGKVS